MESLISWIKQHTILMSDKSFPQNPVELKVGAGQGLSSVCAMSSAEGCVGGIPRVVPDGLFSSQALYNQYIHFKETEIPAKEQEKGQIEELYKLLEVRIILAAQRLVGGNAVLFQQDQTVLSSGLFWSGEVGTPLRIKQAASSALQERRQSPSSLAGIPRQLKAEVGNAILLMFPPGLD